MQKHTVSSVSCCAHGYADPTSFSRYLFVGHIDAVPAAALAEFVSILSAAPPTAGSGGSSSSSSSSASGGSGSWSHNASHSSERGTAKELPAMGIKGAPAAMPSSSGSGMHKEEKAYEAQSDDEDGPPADADTIHGPGPREAGNVPKKYEIDKKKFLELMCGICTYTCKCNSNTVGATAVSSTGSELCSAHEEREPSTGDEESEEEDESLLPDQEQQFEKIRQDAIMGLYLEAPSSRPSRGAKQRKFYDDG